MLVTLGFLAPLFGLLIVSGLRKDGGLIPWITAGLILLANLLDWASTYVFLALGTATEANPLVRAIIERWGMSGALVFKLVFSLVLIRYAWRKPQLALAVAFLFCAVALFNLWLGVIPYLRVL